MRKLLIGCGVLAALVVVVLVVSGIMVRSWFQKRFPDMQKLESMRAESVERFGEPDRFVPPAELANDRVATFVALRDSLARRRGRVATEFSSFLRDAKTERPKNRQTIEKIADAVGMAQGGATMVSGLLDYVGTRLRLGLAAGMGEGEYSWYYCLSTFAWLQWNPLAKPEDEEALRRIEMLDDVREDRRALLDVFETQLGNLRGGLETKAARTPAEEELLRRVQSEGDAARSTGRIPFAGELPPDWAAALEPHRAALVAALPQSAGEAALDLLQVSGENSHVRFDWKTNRRSSKHGRDSTEPAPAGR